MQITLARKASFGSQDLGLNGFYFIIPSSLADVCQIPFAEKIE